MSLNKHCFGQLINYINIRLEAKMALVENAPSTPKQFPSLILPSTPIPPPPPSPGSSFPSSRFFSSSPSSSSSFSSSSTSSSKPGDLVDNLNRTRAVSCIRLWKLQILKKQVESLLESLDTEAHARLGKIFLSI